MLRFTNPFLDLSLLEEGSVALWFKSTDSNARVSRLLDCGDMLSIQQNGTLLRVNLTQNVTARNGSITNTVTRYSLTATSGWLQDWNHLAVSVKDRKARLHVNGVMANETSLNSTFMYKKASQVCTLANNVNLTESFNGLMRHLIFSKEAFTNNSLSMRAMESAENLNILAYFKFDSLDETVYRYNKSR